MFLRKTPFCSTQTEEATTLPTILRGVSKLYAVGPDKVGRKIARKRSEIYVRFAGLDGQQMQLRTTSMDSALSTWTTLGR